MLVNRQGEIIAFKHTSTLFIVLNRRTLTSKDPHIKERCRIDSLSMILMTQQP
ncbi:hypothetical protein [Clostridium bornimense]|uniref:hypothetical protein n=1 Tax=Clostridium bornimense TaxID=1216932 RepID=UPI0012EBF08B|nr:hypothetical protein [Clostridium bornimense]